MVNPRLHIIFVYTCMQLGVYSSCIMDIISSRHASLVTMVCMNGQSREITLMRTQERLNEDLNHL